MSDKIFIECKICNTQFSALRDLSYHLRTHNITKEDYYKTYIAQDDRCGICKECGKPTTFLGLLGYRNFCSLKYAHSNAETKAKKEKTYLEHFGVNHNFKSSEIRKKINFTKRNPSSKKQKLKTIKIISEEPIEIDESTDLSLYVQTKQKIKFKCNVCGKTVYNKLCCFMHRQKLNPENTFLCKQCGYVKTCIEKYGVSNADYINDGKSKRKRIVTDEIINIDYQTDLNQYRKSQKLRFVCKQCKTPSILSTSTLRKNNNFICKQCALKNSLILTYNVTSVMQIHDIFVKSCKFYKYDNKTFDSSWELAYYIWLKDNNINFEYQPNIYFDYTYNNKIHRYFPDFLIDNILYEIKGDQFLKNNTMICPYDYSKDEHFDAKYKCMLQNNIKIISKNEIKPILNYITEKYGKDYLKQFARKN